MSPRLSWRRARLGTYDFATQYSIPFAQLPAFRHLSPEEYQNKIGELIREIEDEGERKRDGNLVAGVERILSQDPFEPPTRVTKRSPKPLCHVASKEERNDLLGGFEMPDRESMETRKCGFDGV